jgi:hypothetical protein
VISDKALKMIKHHEGLRQKPYLCAAKMWTIGVGHVLYPEQVKLPVVRKEGYEGMLRGEYPLKAEALPLCCQNVDDWGWACAISRASQTTSCTQRRL